MNHLLPHIVDALAAVPNPGDGSAPPGFGKFNDIMGWVKWIALGILVMALMAAGVRLAVAGRTLEQEGLVVEVVEEPSAVVRMGLVVRTEPQAGTDVPEGSVVLVVVSSGRP